MGLLAKSYSGCSTLALAVVAFVASPQAAHAQDDADGSSVVGPAVPDLGDEIVVTANRRPEAARDVAGGVSVVTGSDLQAANLTRLTDYQARVPGLNIVSGGAPGLSTVVIRGVASLGNGSLVGTYVDDIPIGSSSGWGRGGSTALDLPPYDISRLEVLRGPQGTLYGASSMGGLIKYATSKPDLQGFSARMGGDVFAIQGASKAGTALRGGVNAPLITDQLGLTWSGFYRSLPGYIDNVALGTKNVNSGEEYGGRVSLLWKAADDFSLRMSAQIHRSKANDLSVVTYTGFAPVNTADGANIIIGRQGVGDLTEAHAFAQPFTKKVNIFSAEVNWGLGFADLVSVTSWSKTHSDAVADASNNYGPLYPLVSGGAIPAGLARFPLLTSVVKFTQEIRLTSPTERSLRWTVGAFYTNERAFLDQRAVAYDNDYNLIPAFQPYLFFANVPTRYREYAVFGGLTWRVSDRFELSSGGRWARNQQDFMQESYGAIIPTASVSSETSESVATYMVSAKYKVTDNVTTYARIASGYRPGGPNTVIPGAPVGYDSDRLTNYEVGVKADVLDRKLSFDLAGFYIDWKKIQLLERAGAVSFYANGGTAVSKGIEFTTSIRPALGLSLGFNAAYTDSHLKHVDPGAAYLLPGYQLPGIPKWSLAGLGSYDWTISSEAQGHLGAQIRHVTDIYASTVGRTSAAASAATVLPAYTTVNVDASVSWGKVTVKLFVNNLTNSRGKQGAAVRPTSGVPVAVDFSIIQPRTVGAGLDVAF
ncbi:MAG: TonB-dependent receptor [Sphingopyxis sp.]|uniref:TonB-dependent receptor n=1 Tax=Sphingopyxis sp. TaxID=1908224 RepID=UPI002AB84920|nr:TonB-dependent receptor [Sphingopyxis sp.]MDZ3833112.1 TonB-dependent receptor [Sphingopyxis sp.]